MADTIKITTRKTNPMRVLLSEANQRHPGGRCFVVSDGRTYEVHETPSVRGLFSLSDRQGNDLVRKGTRGFANAGEDDEVEPTPTVTTTNTGDSGGENPTPEQGGDTPGETPDPKEEEKAEDKRRKATGSK